MIGPVASGIAFCLGLNGAEFSSFADVPKRVGSRRPTFARMSSEPKIGRELCASCISKEAWKESHLMNFLAKTRAPIELSNIVRHSFLLACLSLSFTAYDTSQAAEIQPVQTENVPKLFHDLNGRTCSGSIHWRSNAPGGDTAAGKTFKASTMWIEEADGSASVTFTYGSRPPVTLPALITPSGIKFYGIAGSEYTFNGTSDELIGTGILIPHANVAKTPDSVFRLPCDSQGGLSAGISQTPQRSEADADRGVSSVQFETPAPLTGMSLAARLSRIENGVSPPVLVTGEPKPDMTLGGRMAALHVPGVSIAYIHDGKIAWTRGFGVTRIGGTPVTAETLFQAGSISKPVFAMAAVTLVQAGRLGLDTDVNDLLRGWKVPANDFTARTPVTLRELLSHTAGTTGVGFDGYAAGAPVPSLIDVLNGTPPANSRPIVVTAQPGTLYRYSGGGYEIAQHLLADVTGEHFDALLERSVLAPLHMTHSTFEQPPTEERLHDAATPYLPNGSEVTGGAHTYPEQAAAGLWTTASDLAQFAIGMQDALAGKPGAVLSVAMARTMVTPVLNGSALGWNVGGSGTHSYFFHEGVNAGFVNFLVAYDSGDGAVIMTNGSSGTFVFSLMRSIADEYGWPDFQTAHRTIVAVDPHALERFAGTYRSDPEHTITVMPQGPRLYMETSGQPLVPLLPAGPNDFFTRGSSAGIHFQLDAQGKATSLVTGWGDDARVATRID